MVLNIYFLKNLEIEIRLDEPLFLRLWVPILIMLVYGAAVMLLLFSLTAYHTHLVVANQTTQEEIREKYEKWGGNPYNRGTYSKQNWLYFFRK